DADGLAGGGGRPAGAGEVRGAVEASGRRPLGAVRAHVEQHRAGVKARRASGDSAEAIMVDSVMERAGQGQLDMATLAENIRQLAAEWQPQWRERLIRRELVASDFERLRDAGYLLVGVPEDFGGLWRSAAESTRPVAGLLR